MKNRGEGKKKKSRKKKGGGGISLPGMLPPQNILSLKTFPVC